MTKTKSLILCSLFAALTAVGAVIKIPIPYIPLTMQVFFVIMAGLMLGAKRGAVSMLIYVGIGLAGIPVFTKGGGMHYIFEPTFGYIIGFIFAAYFTGKLSEGKPTFLSRLTAGFVGIFFIYFFGVLYYYMISRLYLHNDMSVKNLLLYCFLMPLPGDILSCFVAAFAARIKEHLH